MNKKKQKKLDILYEDKEIIVVNKKEKQLCISTSKEKEHTLYSEVSQYVKKQYPKNKIFIVHRLDKDTSGIVLFAKNEKMKKLLQQNWNEITTKEYFAVVEGTIPKKKDCLKHYLKETKTLQVYVTEDKKNGKLAITNYEVLKENKTNSLLKIQIKTGRKNQIRVQLSFIGHPIVGDKKYNAKTNPIRRVALHASRLELIHPITKKVMVFESKIPSNFEKIV